MKTISHLHSMHDVTEMFLLGVGRIISAGVVFMLILGWITTGVMFQTIQKALITNHNPKDKL